MLKGLSGSLPDAVRPVLFPPAAERRVFKPKEKAR